MKFEPVENEEETKLEGVQSEEGKALPQNNDYRLSEFKSYVLVFSTENGHGTLASSSMTRDWHEYMLYE